MSTNPGIPIIKEAKVTFLLFSCQKWFIPVHFLSFPRIWLFLYNPIKCLMLIDLQMIVHVGASHLNELAQFASQNR